MYNRKDLIRAIEGVMTVSGNDLIRLCSTASDLRAEGYDRSNEIIFRRRVIGGNVAQAPFDFLLDSVRAGILLDLLNSLSADQIVFEYRAPKHLALVEVGTTSRIIVSPIDETWPIMAEAEKILCRVAGMKLISSLAAVRLAVEKSRERRNTPLGGVYLSPEGALVGMNGEHSHIASLLLESRISDFDGAILPLRSVEMIIGLLSGSKFTAKISLLKNGALGLVCGDDEIQIALMEGKYPENWQGLWESDPAQSQAVRVVTLADKDGFRSWLKTLSVISREGNQTVSIHLSQTFFEGFAAAEIGDVRVTAEPEITGKMLTIKSNEIYLQEALDGLNAYCPPKILPGGQAEISSLTIYFNAPDKPFFIRPTDERGFMAVIAPRF